MKGMMVQCCEVTIWPHQGQCGGSGECVCRVGQSNGNAWGVEDVCAPENLLPRLCFVAIAVCCLGIFITGKILWGSRSTSKYSPIQVRPETNPTTKTSTHPQALTFGSTNDVVASSEDPDTGVSSDSKKLLSSGIPKSTPATEAAANKWKTLLSSSKVGSELVKAPAPMLAPASRQATIGPNSPRKKVSNSREMRQFVAAAFGFLIVVLVLAISLLSGLRLDTVFFLIPLAMLVVHSRIIVLLKAFVKVLPKVVLNSAGGGPSSHNGNKLSDNEVKYLLRMREWLDANDKKFTASICLPFIISVFWSIAPANEPGYDAFILTEMVLMLYLSAILFMASRAATKVFKYLIEDLEKSMSVSNNNVDNDVELGKGDNTHTPASIAATISMYKKVKLMTTTMSMLNVNAIVLFSIILPVLTFIPSLKPRLFNSPEVAFLPMYMILLPCMVSIICAFIVPSSLQ